MNLPLSLSQWLDTSRPETTPVAWRGDRTWTLGHLREDVSALYSWLSVRPEARWALCFEDSYRFLVALLAALYAGKTPIILGHYRLSLLAEQRALFDGVLCDRHFSWDGPLHIVASEPQRNDITPRHLPSLSDDAKVTLFTSGSTGHPKRIIKSIAALDAEAALLAQRFAGALKGCRVVASVVPLHLYGLTFRIFLPMAFGLPLHAATIAYAEQLTALDAQHRYLFISSPAFLKRLDTRLAAPAVAQVVSAGGMLPWRDARQTHDWLQVWPDEIYGSTETGILAWRHRDQDDIAWLPFPGVCFTQEEEAYRVTSPLIADPAGLLLDDILHFTPEQRFHLMGRHGRVIKIEEKRISLHDVERRVLALDGVRDAAALPVMRGGRLYIGVLLVLDDARRQGWDHTVERAWRRALRPWLEPVAIPRFWRVVDDIPVNSMNKRIDAQLQELFHDAP